MLALALALQNDFDIALSWTDLEVKDAAILGVEELNSNEKIEQQVNLVTLDDKGSITQGMLNAQSIIDSDIPIVIGHKESYISAPTSASYAFNKVVMLNVSSTAIDPQEYVHNLMPTAEEISQSIVRYMEYKNISRPIICYAENGYGVNFVRELERALNNKGFDIADKHGFAFGSREEFKDLTEDWENYNTDAIIFVGYRDEAANFLATNSLDVELIFTESLAYEDVVDIPNMRGVIPWIFYPKSLEDKKFLDKFYDRYGRYPNFRDALTYKAIKLVEEALLRGIKDVDGLKDFLTKEERDFERISMKEVDGALKFLGDF